MESAILQTVNLTRQALVLLGAEDEQIRALGEWLIQYGKSRPSPIEREKPIEVSGKHQIG